MTHPVNFAKLSPETRTVLSRLGARHPRVQCLTNTVAQAITANCLLALGARVSMATHPDEIVAMTASADAVLINLGTIDPVREMALARLLDADALVGKCVVLDPVFVELSPLRMRLASALLARGVTIVRGNAMEIAALKAQRIKATRPFTWVTTGAVDRVEHQDQPTREVTSGHPWMAQVTGMGCAGGAVIAACAAVAPDPVTGATTALEVFGTAGLIAAEKSHGPGTFAVNFIDALAASVRDRV